MATVNRVLAWVVFAVAVPAAAQTPIVNPHPVSDTVLLAGALGPGAEDALRQRGIATVIDLRTPEEGTAEARTRFESAGFRYINFPTTGIAPDAERAAAFAALMDDEAKVPVVMHCVSGNRAGMMWAIYALGRGAPLDAVLEQVAPIVTKDPLRDEIVRFAAPVLPP